LDDFLFADDTDGDDGKRCAIDRELGASPATQDALNLTLHAVNP